ncbi:MAG: MFS transporter [Steroidobacteraceae bacterium]
MAANPTSLRSLLAYSGPAIPLAILAMQIIIYVPPLYAEHLHLDIASVGLVFFLARAWDALVDPMLGYLSDRTRSRWGRRKPWMLAAPLLACALYAFCQPPAGVGLGYLGFWAFAFYSLLGAVLIPYQSWGAELSRDYAVRTRIASYREGGTILGVVLATAIPLLYFGGERPAIDQLLAVLIALIVPLLLLSTAIALLVTPQGSYTETSDHGLAAALRALQRNKPLQRLLVGIFFFWLGGSVYNACVIFVVNHVLRLALTDFLWFVLAQYAVSMLMLPLMVKLANRFGRHRVLTIGAMGWFAMHPFMLLVPPGSFAGAMTIYVIAGVFTGVIWVLPPALIQDTVEYGMLKGGGDDAALYMALYNFAFKAALAVGAVVALPLLGALGFEPSAPGAGLEGLKFTGLILPGLIGLAGAALLFNYPITAARHDAIRRRLAQRARHGGRPRDAAATG